MLPGLVAVSWLGEMVVFLAGTGVCSMFSENEMRRHNGLAKAEERNKASFGYLLWRCCSLHRPRQGRRRQGCKLEVDDVGPGREGSRLAAPQPGLDAAGRVLLHGVALRLADSGRDLRMAKSVIQGVS